ncbi:unnamed protein product [Thelazia callipaeda]|uniref:Delta-like protein n=1 Tax=Thelazia callipaeda TaxID=103827 RepID=A0A0N5CZP4_THECL|nr:unnamed protein product [Thelazia callipaeda]
MHHYRISTIYIMILGYNILRLSIILLLLLQCSCAGSFEIRLISLKIDPKVELRPEFRICLKNFETHISHNNDCTFGEVTCDAERLRNGAKIEFKFGWPESFKLITEVWRTNGKMKKLMFDDAFQRENVPSSAQWTEKVLFDSGGFGMTIAYRIICASDYYGPQCSKFCQPISGHVGHYECNSNGTLTCSAGWEGANCDTARCDNCVNGVCDRPGSCRCKTGWTGPSCDQCKKYPGCKHGFCRQPNQCICEEGWGGHFCIEDLNYCSRHQPCKNNAICRNTGHGQYTCECPYGFTGTNCEIRLQNCSTQSCMNGAICTYIPGYNYTCICPKGYTGRYCQVVAKTCSDSPCHNGGTCIQNRGLFFCECMPGWNGTNCDIKIRTCDHIHCYNDGKCVEGNGTGEYDCICKLGFTGKHCEKIAKECAQHNPCLNGGRCIDEVKNYKCQCPDGFSGTLCEHSINVCQNKPCKNGGRCGDLKNNKYLCSCPEGFKGVNCEIAKSGCDENPCRNGATCINADHGFRCLCPPCFYGESCSHFDRSCRPLHRYNRTNAYIIKLENEIQTSSSGLNLKDLVLILLSISSVLALIFVVVVIYRQKIARRTSTTDPSLQNDLNSKRLSKYSEQKACLNKRTGSNTEISYFERAETNNSATISDKKRLSHPNRNSLDYSNRYAIEPTINVIQPPLNQNEYMGYYNKMDLRHSRRPNVTRVTLPTQSSKDGDSYYEEIDDESSVPEMVVQRERHTKVGASNVNHSSNLDGHPETQLQNMNYKVTDIQTNL